MAEKRMNEAFSRYQEEIIGHPAYAGMPDLRYPDGHIQWEAPSNRSGGQFKDSHDKRLQWWREKANEIGVPITTKQWISRVAKTIHPTKRRPCKVCGRVMDIRYCYLSSSMLGRIEKLPFYADDIELDECTSILDFLVEYTERYGGVAFESLPALLTCKAVPDVPDFGNDVDMWERWLEEEYIPKEPSLLSPGAMSNAPDRLDGFHSYNRCCRPNADKGRSKINLASYSTDRRAFEYWVDGNWVAANKTMGLIRSDPEIKELACYNEGDSREHPKPCSADHVGPISLGFSHQPFFRLLCSPCNSAKNNRMYYSDVKYLIARESEGVQVASWYLEPVWTLTKNWINNDDDALRLAKILRDNRYNAMEILAKLLDDSLLAVLVSYLNLDYASRAYHLIDWEVQDGVLEAQFMESDSSLEYTRIQKARRFRVAIQSLRDYSEKERRNGLNIDLPENETLYEECKATVKRVDYGCADIDELIRGFIEGNSGSDEDAKAVIDQLPNDRALNSDECIIQVKQIIFKMIQNIAAMLSSAWDDPRYSRETSYGIT
jgi:Alw26I/Eco31I/Esp3I family type II restriction endonuclease